MMKDELSLSKILITNLLLLLWIIFSAFIFLNHKAETPYQISHEQLHGDLWIYEADISLEFDESMYNLIE